MRSINRSSPPFVPSRLTAEEPPKLAPRWRALSGEPREVRWAIDALNVLLTAHAKPALALLPRIARLDDQPAGPAALCVRKGHGLYMNVFESASVYAESKLEWDPRALTVFAIRLLLEREDPLADDYGRLLIGYATGAPHAALDGEMLASAHSLLNACASRLGLGSSPMNVAWFSRTSFKRDFYGPVSASIRAPRVKLTAVFAKPKSYAAYREMASPAARKAASVLREGARVVRAIPE
jgi:hypothetical protein